jgi:hypothetical protein
MKKLMSHLHSLALPVRAGVRAGASVARRALALSDDTCAALRLLQCR